MFIKVTLNCLLVSFLLSTCVALPHNISPSASDKVSDPASISDASVPPKSILVNPKLNNTDNLRSVAPAPALNKSSVFYNYTFEQAEEILYRAETIVNTHTQADQQNITTQPGPSTSSSRDNGTKQGYAAPAPSITSTTKNATSQAIPKLGNQIQKTPSKPPNIPETPIQIPEENASSTIHLHHAHPLAAVAIFLFSIITLF